MFILISLVLRNCGTGHDSMDVHSMSVWTTFSMMMSSAQGIIYHLEELASDTSQRNTNRIVSYVGCKRGGIPPYCWVMTAIELLQSVAKKNWSNRKTGLNNDIGLNISLSKQYH